MSLFKKGNDMKNREASSEIPVKNHLDKLGLKCRDRVSNFEGVITSICFDLYGCVSALVNPGVDEKGIAREQNWYDVQRLEILSDEPVMKQPNFLIESTISAGNQGAAEKPSTAGKY